jgi:hypothetical protein
MTTVTMTMVNQREMQKIEGVSNWQSTHSQNPNQGGVETDEDFAGRFEYLWTSFRKDAITQA